VFISVAVSLAVLNGTEYQQTAMLFLATFKFNSLHDPDTKCVYEIRRSILDCISWAGFKRVHLAVLQAFWGEVFFLMATTASSSLVHK
jgi:hypothetical protein